MVLYCYGDSNTYGYDPRSFFGGRYPKQTRWTGILENKLGCRIINGGMNGRCILGTSGVDSLASILERVVEENAGGVGVDADIHLLVMLGTNDLLGGMDAALVADEMDSFLEPLMGYPAVRKTNPILISPPKLRRGAWVEYDMLVEQSALLGEAMRPVAMKHGMDFLDAGGIEVDLCFDGVHFSEHGHRAFAEFVAGHFQKN